MLPAGHTFQETLNNVDFGLFGVEPGIAIAALTAYQADLAREAKAKPIELGARMFVVRRYDDPNLPYVLVSSAAAAKSLTARQRKALNDVNAPTVGAMAMQIRRRVQQIGLVLGVENELEDRASIADMFAGAALCMGSNARHDFFSASPYGERPLIEKADEKFGVMVVLGLDAVSCSLATAGEEYGNV